MRALLIRLSPDRHTLLLTFHHTVFDGWSFRILAHEISEFYTGNSARLLALPVQYADYAVWQQRLDGRQSHGAAIGVLARTAATAVSRFGTRRRQAEARGPDIPRRLAAAHILHYPYEAPPRIEPARGRNPVHDAAGRLPGASPPIHRTDRYHRRLAGGGPQPHRNRRTDRVFCQHARAPNRSYRRSRIFAN